MKRTPGLGLVLVIGLLTGGPCAAQDSVRAADTYNAASGMLARGLDDLAAEEYEKFLSEFPRHELADQARYGLGVARSRLGQHEETIEALTTLLGDDDFRFHAEAALLSARSHLALNQPGEAAGVLTDALGAHGGHALAAPMASLLVESLSRSGENDEAVEMYETHRSALTGPHAERATYFAALAEIARGNPRQAVGLLGLLGRLESGTSPIAASARLMLARTLHQTGETESAASAYRVALDKADEAQRPEIVLGLAQVLADLDRLEEAVAQLDKIEERSVSDDLRLRTRLERGRIACLGGDFDLARRTLEPVHRRAPESLGDDAAYWLARAYSGQGEHARASEVLAKALETHPDSGLVPELTYQLGLALGASGDHDEACRVLRELARNHAGEPIAGEALLAAASFAQASGDMALAERLSDEASGGLTGDAAFDASYLGAESAYQREDYRSAAQAFTQLLEQLPKGHRHRAMSIYRLGMSQSRLGDTVSARRTLGELFAKGDPDERFLPALLTLGDLAFAEGDWGDAAKWLERYTELGPDVPSWDEATLRLGLALGSSGNRTGAASAFERLIEASPDSSLAQRAQYELALVALALDDSARAVRAFEAAAKGQDTEIARHALEQLGSLAGAAGDHAKAASYFAQGASLGPDDAGSASRLNQARALVAGGDYREAADVLGRLELGSLEPSPRAEASALLTISLAQLAKHDEAIRASEPLIRSRQSLGELDPQTASWALSERARSLRALKRDPEAERTLTLLLETFPESPLAPTAHLELADIAMGDERYTEAAGHCLAILRMQEPPGAALLEQAAYRLGVSARELGNHAGVVEALTELAERTPTDRLSASASLIAGESLLELGRHAEAAELLAIGAASQEPEIAPIAMLRLGEAELGLQRWARAEATYAEFLSAHSGDPRAYLALFGRAWAQENQGRQDEAIAGYREVVAQHDGETAARAQFQIGECLYAQKKHEEAVRELLRVDLVYAYPQWSAGALYEAGRCFEALDRVGDARAQYEAVVERFAETQWAELAHRRLNAIEQDSTQQGG